MLLQSFWKSSRSQRPWVVRKGRAAQSGPDSWAQLGLGDGLLSGLSGISRNPSGAGERGNLVRGALHPLPPSEKILSHCPLPTHLPTHPSLLQTLEWRSWT